MLTVYFYCFVWLLILPTSFVRSITFKGSGWRPIPAHPRCADCHNDRTFKCASSRAFDRYAVAFYYFIWLLILPTSFVRSIAFKGSSWRPIPAHPRCADCHNDGTVKCASSRAFDRYARCRILLFRLTFNITYVFCQISRLQGKQLTTDSNTPSMCGLS